MAEKKVVRKDMEQRKQVAAKACFDNLVALSEANYDRKVTLLLRFVEIADKEGDSKKLEKAKEITLAWKDFFEGAKGLSKKQKTAKSAGSDSIAKFVDDQIGFFDKLDGEIGKKLKELKAKKIRKSLE